jgi:protein TonB
MSVTIAMATAASIAMVQSPPLSSPGSWFSSADYPADALKAGQEGIVGTSMEIDANGTPKNCTIEKSSGFPALDSATCPILLNRARFSAIRSSIGAATTWRYHQSVVWTIKSDSMNFSNKYLTVSVDISNDGSTSNCIAKDSESASVPSGPCSTFGGARFLHLAFGDKYITTKSAVTRLYFELGEDKDSVSVSSDKFDRIVTIFKADLEVSPTGKITSCNPVEIAERFRNGPDLCANLGGSWTFKPSQGVAKARAATLTLDVVGQPR